jgi:hypothetical protein
VAVNPDVDRLLAALRTYRAARDDFLAVLGCVGSNRDPFAEFSERVAVAALGGTLASSRTQKGWDFIDSEGCRVQVRYLANPSGPWVNGHVVDFRGEGCDRYALVIFEALDAQSLIVFDHAYLADVGRALGKRHPGQEDTLQLGQANYRTIVGAPDRFADLGVKVMDLRNLA